MLKANDELISNIVKSLIQTDVNHNVNLIKNFYYYRNISIFEVRSSSSICEVFKISKENMSILVKKDKNIAESIIKYTTKKREIYKNKISNIKNSIINNLNFSFSFDILNIDELVGKKNRIPDRKEIISEEIQNQGFEFMDDHNKKKNNKNTSKFENLGYCLNNYEIGLKNKLKKDINISKIENQEIKYFNTENELVKKSSLNLNTIHIPKNVKLESLEKKISCSFTNYLGTDTNTNISSLNNNTNNFKNIKNNSSNSNYNSSFNNKKEILDLSKHPKINENENNENKENKENDYNNFDNLIDEIKDKSKKISSLISKSFQVQLDDNLNTKTKPNIGINSIKTNKLVENQINKNNKDNNTANLDLNKKTISISIEKNLSKINGNNKDNDYNSLLLPLPFNSQLPISTKSLTNFHNHIRFKNNFKKDNLNNNHKSLNEKSCLSTRNISSITDKKNSSNNNNSVTKLFSPLKSEKDKSFESSFKNNIFSFNFDQTSTSKKHNKNDLMSKLLKLKNVNVNYNLEKFIYEKLNNKPIKSKTYISEYQKFRLIKNGIKESINSKRFKHDYVKTEIDSNFISKFDFDYNII